MTTVFINELHYENIFIDVGEGVEIAGPAGTHLDGWTLVFYNGDDKKSYLTTKLSGLVPNLQNGFGVLFFRAKGIKSGSKHGAGVALVNDGGKVIQFLSYGSGSGFSAADGPASGAQSSHIPVKESNLSFQGNSLQLIGTGSKYEDFKWTGPVKSSFGSVNKGQTFTGGSNPQPQPQPEPQPQPTNVAPLGSGTIDTMTNENKTKHWTAKYHIPEMIILRRGFDFSFRYTPKGSATDVTVVMENYPEGKAKSSLKVQSKASNSGKWEAYLSKTEGKIATISVAIPVDVPVGQYKLSLQDGGSTVALPDPIVILFNPFCEKDQVYMDNAAWREEYVLNDEGAIWTGSAYNNGPRPWNFGQFNTKSLQCSLKLLEMMPYDKRGDPVTVSRHMSAAVNVQDDKGVLVGNWSGKYDGGKSPSEWTGSAEILKTYFLTGESVKYGQCWVFSGVLTAVMRSLGVPARSVTNFASAHDTTQPFNRAVDKYFKRNLEEDEDKTTDSIWNFHVWNDVWMTRPDLKNPKYNGWQAIDATPQERSDRKYQTGPAPVNAIKNGDKDIQYDLEFIYSEVNADVKHWVEKEDGSGYDLTKTITDGVGVLVATKAVGSNKLNNATLEYKYKEGSKEERESVAGTLGNATVGGVRYHDETDEIVADIDVLGNQKLGDPIPVKVSVARKKDGNATLTAKITLTASCSSYSSRIAAKKLKEVSGSVNVPSSKDQSGALNLLIATEDYLPYLNIDPHFSFKAMIQIKENNYSTVITEDFTLLDVPIELDLLTPASALKLGSKGKVRATVTNPLNVPLTSASLQVEGQALIKVIRFDLGTIGARSEVTKDFEIDAWETGPHTLIAKLLCNEVRDGITGSVSLVVLK